MRLDLVSVSVRCLDRPADVAGVRYWVAQGIDIDLAAQHPTLVGARQKLRAQNSGFGELPPP